MSLRIHKNWEYKNEDGNFFPQTYSIFSENKLEI